MMIRRNNIVTGLLFFLCLCHTMTCLAKGYVVGEGDTLKISVYNHQDLDTTVRVGGEGEILMPLLGPVRVSGLTVPQVADKIGKMLSDGYLVNPQVNIFIEEFRSKKMVILGQIMKPGVYELSGPTTFLELISQAGGLTADAGDNAIIKSSSRVTDKRSPEKFNINELSQKEKSEQYSANVKARDGEVVRMINIKSLLEGGNLTENITINDGDHVYVEKAGICYVSGEVTKPGAYRIDKDTTVINAITLAGGFTGKATKKYVNIIRVVNGKKTTLEDMPLNEPVTDQDIVIVPESFF